jgi:hypothetical protein
VTKRRNSAQQYRCLKLIENEAREGDRRGKSAAVIAYDTSYLRKEHTQREGTAQLAKSEGGATTRSHGSESPGAV